MTTAICLVTMNRADTLRQTVEAIHKHSTGEWLLLIVDNGSDQEDHLALLDEYSNDDKIRLVRNTENKGLGYATNQGFHYARQLRPDWPTLIHMDDDALIRQTGWNQTLHEFLTRNEEVGCVAPDRGNVGVIRHKRYTEVRWFLGMIWALRANIYDEIGAYDEQLLHQQECDMCLRVRMHGYLAAQCPEFPISGVHHNDHAERTPISLAREDMGTVQFHDKWCEYFRGRGASYGTTPRYLMQHFPIDQDFFERLAIQNRLGFDKESPSTVVDGQTYWIHRDIRPDDAWLEPHGSDRYEDTKQQIINRWNELTGVVYTGYDWGRVTY